MRRLSEYLMMLYSLTGVISIAASQVVLAIGALALGVDRLRKRTLTWAPTGLEWPLLAWTAAAILATLFAADPSASAEKLRKLPLLATVLWPATAVHRKWNLGRLYVGLFFSAGVTSLYGVLTFFLHGGSELGARISGFHGFYMTNSGLLLLCTFPALLFALCPQISTSFRWGAGLAAVSILTAQLFGRLPGAWIGTAAGLCFLAVRRRQPLWAIFVPAVLASFFVLPGAPAAFRDATSALVNLESSTNRDRTVIWVHGVELFARDPWTGWGLHDLRHEYERVRRPGEPTQGHMHSVPIQVAASMGLPGLIAFGWLVFALFRALARARHCAGKDPFFRAATDGGEAGLVAFLAAGLVEWNFGDSEILTLLCFLVGAAIAAGRIAQREA
jgi:O-antigen ligase